MVISDESLNQLFPTPKKLCSTTVSNRSDFSARDQSNQVSQRDVFSLRDSRVCSAGAAAIHSGLSAATHHRVIYNSVLRLSRLTAGSSADDTGAEQQLRASLPQSIPRMPVHGRVGAHAYTHARVVTFDSFLTSAAGEGGEGSGHYTFLSRRC